jgi:hypothetical protein
MRHQLSKSCRTVATLPLYGYVFHCDSIQIWLLTVDAQYELLIDINAHVRRRAPEFELQSFFGQLEHIFVIKLPATADLKLTEPTTLILVSIRTCDVEAHNSLDMHFYSKMGRTEVVDITSVQCVVGRVKTRNSWAILDRSGGLARAYYDPNNE